MKDIPNPELIDKENPEWTEAMLNEAKTADELFPHLIAPSIQAVFQDLCGILTATHSVFLEEMEQAISVQAQVRFINAVESFSKGRQEMLHGEYHPIDTSSDDKP